ncbi:TrgA family protein [Pseudoroseicyclus sp. CLL3-39]|uniref:TrgA family protein n=1 Tax=Pseudoroseicyclus tamaricis TaxID=2705421 RepID=A0A6B2JRD1_9RHOB|nr:TrgA family protein [Pseudoroseicyclus tamaricis]
MVSALMFAGLALIVATSIVPLYPPGVIGPNFGWWNAALAVVIGWLVLGRQAGHGYVTAIGIGLTTSAALALWSLFLFSFAQMIDRSFQKVYDGPTEALVDVFRYMWENLQAVAVQEVLLTLAIGGAVIGVVVEYVSHRAR